MKIPFFKKLTNPKIPNELAREEAMINPGGWVYEIEGDFTDEQDVPPQAIVGAWKVDDRGKIVGEFMPNPNFESKD